MLLLIIYRDRTDTVGYKLSVIPFQNGEPLAAPDNKTAVTDIFANVDNSVCPQNCFRPVGIAFDSKGRLFVSSDATGEIYVVQKDTPPPGATSTAASAKPSSTSGTAKRFGYSLAALVLAMGPFCLLF